MNNDSLLSISILTRNNITIWTEEKAMIELLKTYFDHAFC